MQRDGAGVAGRDSDTEGASEQALCTGKRAWIVTVKVVRTSVRVGPWQ